MLFWFVATAVVSVHVVFRDAGFDHRLLIVGAVIPVIGAVTGPWSAVLLSVLAPVVALVVVMAVTTGRRPIRRTLLGLPIGMFLHLVYTGSWTDSGRFWWPALGGALDEVTSPIAARGLWNVLLEVIGFVGVASLARRAGLDRVDRRRAFIERGTLTLGGG